MILLFIGDIVGAPGRKALRALLPALRARHGVQLVIANGENSAGGAGITPETAAEIFAAGVDLITSGDHLWDQKEVTELLLREPRFLRPLNYPAGTLGQGSTVWQREGLPPVGVMNVQGRTFMPPLENPFTLARLLDGRVSAVVGTHTHVQTADEQIFPGGTAYLSDAGFTGPHESVLGREIEPVVRRFQTCAPQRFGIATGRVLLQGALITVDDASGRATDIRRISEPLPPHA